MALAIGAHLAEPVPAASDEAAQLLDGGDRTAEAARTALDGVLPERSVMGGGTLSGPAALGGAARSAAEPQGAPFAGGADAAEPARPLAGSAAQGVIPAAEAERSPFAGGGSTAVPERLPLGGASRTAQPEREAVHGADSNAAEVKWPPFDGVQEEGGTAASGSTPAPPSGGGAAAGVPAQLSSGAASGAAEARIADARQQPASGGAGQEQPPRSSAGGGGGLPPQRDSAPPVSSLQPRARPAAEPLSSFSSAPAHGRSWVSEGTADAKLACLRQTFGQGVEESEAQVWSRNNEDGIIDALFECLGTRDQCAALLSPRLILTARCMAATA